jgi:uncharacterized protein
MTDHPNAENMNVSESEIFDTVYYTDLDRVRSILGENPQLVNAKNDKGWTPIQMAAAFGHLDIVDFLIEKNADVNSKDNEDNTPLHYSASRPPFGKGLHQEGIPRALITAGADVNATSWNGTTPLHNAAGSGLKDVVQLLISNGADIHAKDRHDRTPLTLAEFVGGDRRGIIQILRTNGAG